jgi:hypothetical protein
MTAMLNLMDFKLTGLPGYYQLLPPMLTHSHFFTNCRPAEQVEVGLIVIALLSYQAEGRQDIA